MRAITLRGSPISYLVKCEVFKTLMYCDPQPHGEGLCVILPLTYCRRPYCLRRAAFATPCLWYILPSGHSAVTHQSYWGMIRETKFLEGKFPMPETMRLTLQKSWWEGPFIVAEFDRLGKNTKIKIKGNLVCFLMCLLNRERTKFIRGWVAVGRRVVF